MARCNYNGSGATSRSYIIDMGLVKTCHQEAETKSILIDHPQMQFGIRRLLFIVAFSGLMVAPFAAYRHSYHKERRQNRSALNNLDGISILDIRGFIDFTEEIVGTSFSVKCHPGSIVSTGNLYNYEKTGQFGISRIGQWKFVVTGERYCGAYKSSTWEPVISKYWGYSIILGRNSPYAELFPFEIESLQDVADHYAELVDVLESWPTESDPGQVMLADGSIQHFYVVEDPSPGAIE